MAFFFRDPKRVPPDDPKRCRLRRLTDESRALNRRLLNRARPTVVSIFLSPLDVHINRSPIPGKITDMVYSPRKVSDGDE